MKTSFDAIITLSGHNGLFRIVRPTHRGLLVESIDAHKVRSVKDIQSNKISTLNDISIYTKDDEDTVSLPTVLVSFYKEFKQETIPNDTVASSEKLCALMQRVLPHYDPDRVYSSNIKKMAYWYNILVKYMPELLQNTPQEQALPAKAEAKTANPKSKASEEDA